MKTKMKEKIKVSSLPLLAGIALGIVAMAVPWITANHYIWVDATRYSADNYLFFLWGKYYTVTGAKVIQSRMMLYSLGDFPIYAMITIVISLVLGFMSIFGGKALVMNVKGRELKLKLGANPIWLLTASTSLLIFAYIYLQTSSIALEAALIKNNYVPEIGPSLDYLLGSIAAFGVATIMTAVKYLTQKEQTNPNVSNT